ncbi:GNAT family N-acetyltransferase [uncultured Maricaulis sp.]|uniref:GNAT family N-acetyltransferase n=1 Tax=uncultured Maricaulis sp. TaxID=174710 RepID=UPI0030D8A905
MRENSFERSGYRITDQRSAFDLASAHRLLSTSYWSPGIPPETVAKAAANAWTFCLLAPDGEFAGMARFITDRATFAYLADVIIDPAHRGHGLGKWLVECLHSLPEIQACRRLMLMTADAQPLYARFGYTPLKSPERAMEVSRPDPYRADPLRQAEPLTGAEPAMDRAACGD